MTDKEDKFISQLIVEAEKLELRIEAEIKRDLELQPVDTTALRSRINQAMDHEGSGRRLKLIRVTNVIWQTYKTISGIAMLILIMSIAIVTTVEAARQPIFNWIVSMTNQQMTLEEVTVPHPSYIQTLPDEWIGRFAPHYIPHGFELEAYVGEGVNGTLIFSNSQDTQIVFWQGKKESLLSLDSEDASISELTIHDYPAILIIKEKKTLTWKNEEKAFTLYSVLEIDELVRIAESICIIE